MRLFLLLFICCWCFCSSAQFSKSNLFLGGLGSYSTDKGSDHKDYATKDVSNVLIGTKAGYFLINKLLIGVSANWSRNKTNTSVANVFYYQQSETKTRAITIGPFVRYYIVKGLFGEVGYGWGKSRLQRDTFSQFQGSTSRTTEDDKIKISIISPGLGYSFIIGSSRNIGIDVDAFYRYQKQEPITFNGLLINVAVSAFINTKKKI